VPVPPPQQKVESSTQDKKNDMRHI